MMFGISSSFSTDVASAMWYRSPCTTCIGDNIFPVRFAGHTSVHLPQTAQAKASNSCFWLKSFIFDAPKDSAVSKSVMVVKVPFAPNCRVTKPIGAPTRCTCLDIGMYTEKPKIIARCTHQLV